MRAAGRRHLVAYALLGGDPMKRDPIWTAIEVFFSGIGAVLAIGLVRLANALIDWVAG